MAEYATSEMLQRAVIDELKELFDGKKYTSPEGERALRFYKQFLPISTSDDDEVETDESPFPCIIVKLSSGEITKVNQPQKVLVQVIVASYDTGLDRQGYVDVVNIKEDIVQHFLSHPSFGGAFSLAYPCEWELSDDDFDYYYWGVVNLIISIPAKANEMAEDLL